MASIGLKFERIGNVGHLFEPHLGISLKPKAPTDAATVSCSRPDDSGPGEHLQLTPEDAQKVRIDSLPRSFSFDRPRLGRKQSLDLQAQKLLEDCRSEMAQILKRKKYQKTRRNRLSSERLKSSLIINRRGRGAIDIWRIKQRQ
jgi:hypothetical protein